MNKEEQAKLRADLFRELDKNTAPAQPPDNPPDQAVRSAGSSEAASVLTDRELLNWAESRASYAICGVFSNDEWFCVLTSPVGVITDSTLRKVLARWKAGDYDKEEEHEDLHR